jgi:tRNA(fMet)-specific endonuclease VapC
VTSRYLLDTSIVSVPLVRAPNARVIDRLAAHGHESAIAAPVWHELVFGCARLPRGKRRLALESYLYDVVQPSFPILPYDDVAAAWHAQERARLEAVGRSPPYVDGQIAAIAHAHDLCVVTTNAKDFARFKDLSVEDWSQRAGRS